MRPLSIRRRSSEHFAACPCPRPCRRTRRLLGCRGAARRLSPVPHRSPRAAAPPQPPHSAPPARNRLIVRNLNKRPSSDSLPRRAGCGPQSCAVRAPDFRLWPHRRRQPRRRLSGVSGPPSRAPAEAPARTRPTRRGCGGGSGASLGTKRQGRGGTRAAPADRELPLRPPHPFQPAVRVGRAAVAGAHGSGSGLRLGHSVAIEPNHPVARARRFRAGVGVRAAGGRCGCVAAESRKAALGPAVAAAALHNMRCISRSKY